MRLRLGSMASQSRFAGASCIFQGITPLATDSAISSGRASWAYSPGRAVNGISSERLASSASCAL